MKVANEKTSTVNDIVETGYGLYISLDAKSTACMKRALKCPAKRTVEVAVRYKGTTKEFTFAEFLGRLGFIGGGNPLNEVMSDD